ncbi:MAG: response regulator transcription factor [Burkholderiales bacterium]
MRIALLEEGGQAAETVGGWLRSTGYETVVHESGKAFIGELAVEPCDLLVVGAAPDISGMDVLVWVREHMSATIPILRIAEKNTEQEIVASLKAGADDCVVRPVRRLEFLARVEALGRRVPRSPKCVDLLRFGDLSVDLKNRVISRDGQRIALTPKSYDLAVFLFSNLGQLLSRSYLMERIWGRGSSTSTRTLDTHISRLRTDLGLTPENGWILQSIYQHGYRLEQTDPRPAVLRAGADREQSVC